MIYVLEIPHRLPPSAWSRSNKAQIMSAIAEHNSGETIYEERTGRELLDIFGYETTTEMREDNDALTGLADLVDSRGLDTTLYKAWGDDDYGVEPVDEWAAHLECNGHDLSAQRVYMSDDEARSALADDSAWSIHQGHEGRRSLEKEMALCSA